MKTRILLLLSSTILLFVCNLVLAAATSERDIITSNSHSATWVYFTDSSNSKWYISPVMTSKAPVYSLGPIGINASWRTVGNGVAKVDLANNAVTVDSNLDSDSSDTFYDIGIQENITDKVIHSDRQKIQGSTVFIKWYFFKAPNNSWYIVNAPGYGEHLQVLRFSQKNGQYDWPPVDMTSAGAFFNSVTSGGYLQVGFRVFQIDGFISDRQGTRTDMDGSYGAQCVDLMHAYIDQTLGVKYPHGFTGNAYAVYSNAATATTKYSDLFSTSVTFTKIQNSPSAVPTKGDIIFWNQAPSNGQAGHVAIFIEGDVNRFTSLDQNWVNASETNGSPAAVVEHTYTGVTGWLHPEMVTSTTVTSSF